MGTPWFREVKQLVFGCTRALSFEVHLTSNPKFCTTSHTKNKARIFPSESRVYSLASICLFLINQIDKIGLRGVFLCNAFSTTLHFTREQIAVTLAHGITSSLKKRKRERKKGRKKLLWFFSRYLHSSYFFPLDREDSDAKASGRNSKKK